MAPSSSLCWNWHSVDLTDWILPHVMGCHFDQLNSLMDFSFIKCHYSFQKCNSALCQCDFNVWLHAEVHHLQGDKAVINPLPSQSVEPPHNANPLPLLVFTISLIPLARTATCKPMALCVCSIPAMWPAMCSLSSAPEDYRHNNTEQGEGNRRESWLL